MRYLKVFFLVVIFFVVMMFFVQNQASFSDPVTLKFDPMFAPVVTSIPLPRYSLMLICLHSALQSCWPCFCGTG